MRKTDDIMWILYFKRGWSQRKIADLFGCNVATVCRHIEKQRWERWEIVMSPHQLRKLYEKLGSIRKVADALWCSVGTVHKRMVEYGIPRKQIRVQKKIHYEHKRK